MTVPPFRMYFPTDADMNRQQLEFYRQLEARLNKGEYIDIEGNISYVYVYLYKLILYWDRLGFEQLRARPNFTDRSRCAT